MEYQNEKDYEGRKKLLMDNLYNTARMLHNAQCKHIEKLPSRVDSLFNIFTEIMDVLRQSKWINAYPTADDIKKAKKIAFEDGYHSGYTDGEDESDYID